MLEISLCMIVKNEEEVLANCLNSVKPLIDEIIIVDTGSTDKTKEIAQSLGAKVYDFEWVDDFSKARNYSFSLATKDYVMWLDADDIILEKDLNVLLDIKQNKLENNDVDAISMYYHTILNERGEPTFLYRRNRIVKRSNNYQWYGFVHEFLSVWGNVFLVDCAVTHNKEAKKVATSNENRNIIIYKQKLDEGVQFTARDMYYFGNELREHGEFEEAMKQYQDFLDSKNGWFEDNILACVHLYECNKHVKKDDDGLKYLFESFRYDEPRPIVCCLLGDYFLENKKYENAIAWYTIAFNFDTSQSMAFQNLMYSSWYPHLQMCVCNDKLGHIEKALFHHGKVKELNPNHPAVKHNEEYFNSLKK